MKLNNTNVRQTIDEAKKLLEMEKNISPALRSIIGLLLIFMEVLINRFGLTSSNSSKSPSSDPNRKKQSRKTDGPGRKPGGQEGRIGKQLKPVSDPDVIEVIKLDKRKLPKDSYTDAGFESRQVIDYDVSICVTEYQAQVLLGSNGKRFVAPFPDHVKRPIQYGHITKSTAVYMSQFQLIPYARIVDYFKEQVGLPISPGTLFNFNKGAYDALENFEKIAKSKLVESKRINVDETGVNINGKRLWLHTTCNDKWTYFHPHAKRGKEAMDEIGILPGYKDTACHDHWKPYFQYDCKHALCNAHHLRELEWSKTEDKQQWAAEMQEFLIKLNRQVDEAGGELAKNEQEKVHEAYKNLLKNAEIECPPPDIQKDKPKRGRIKRSKSRNLLERFINYEQETLRFMTDVNVPFTNNQGENDLRMTKVQQKISGCFRSEEGAYIFCRVRAYLITCRKHGISPTDALKMLFQGKMPDFVHL
jgi:transposase